MSTDAWRGREHNFRMERLRWAPKRRASQRGVRFLISTAGAKFRTCGPEMQTEQTTFKTGNLNFKIGDGGLEGRMVKESNKGRISEQEEAKFRMGADV
jgi:hypothetical protein